MFWTINAKEGERCKEYSGKSGACGRSISVTDAMWDIARVIPDCVVTGEAAGVAAAISDDFAALDVSCLQKKLQENGVRLHLEDVGLVANNQ